MFPDLLVAVADRVLKTIAQPDPCFEERIGSGVSPKGGSASSVAGMMRVDHSGEVCAQALYLAQAAFARSPDVRAHMLKSAAEESVHLDLTLHRLGEIGARPSQLNPLWFVGSFALGSMAAVAGDRISLGFLSETERQVSEHLEGHLRRIAADDRASRSILRRMRDDETTHAASAEHDGGSEFPFPVRAAMRASAKVMTTLAPHY